MACCRYKSHYGYVGVFWSESSYSSTMCRGEPQTRTHGMGSRSWFHIKPVFPPPLPNYYLFLKRIPYRPLRSCPRNRPLVNSWEGQSLAATTVLQRFGHCICSELKYGECTKYVRVEAWTRACEQSVYVVCVPGWFIKWVVIVMVMCYCYGDVLPLWWCVTVMVMCYCYGDVIVMWCVIITVMLLLWWCYCYVMCYCYDDVLLL